MRWQTTCYAMSTDDVSLRYTNKYCAIAIIFVNEHIACNSFITVSVGPMCIAACVCGTVAHHQVASQIGQINSCCCFFPSIPHAIYIYIYMYMYGMHIFYCKWKMERVKKNKWKTIEYIARADMCCVCNVCNIVGVGMGRFAYFVACALYIVPMCHPIHTHKRFFFLQSKWKAKLLICPKYWDDESKRQLKEPE